MKELVHQAGRDHEFQIDSAAVSTEEIGNPIYPPAQRKLREHHVPFDGHYAHQITRAEFNRYDLIILMDQSNMRILARLLGNVSMDKVHLMMSYTGSHRDVEDPWYTGDFEAAYRDILAGCTGLLGSLL